MTGPEDVPAAFQFAWNAHDMVAFAALFHVDARFVNRFGHYVRGIEEISAMHQPIDATVYRDSTLENALIDSIPISEDATVLHFWSRLSVGGAAHPAGAHAVDTLVQAVVTKRDEQWRIQALEDVTFTDPRTGEARLRD